MSAVIELTPTGAVHSVSRCLVARVHVASSSLARAAEFPVAGPRILLSDRVVWTRAAPITIKIGYIRRNGLVSARKKPAVVNTAINRKAARNASAISVWMAAS